MSSMTWTTADERAYLESIGRVGGETQKIGRREMLERYIVAAEQRERWGAIDGDEIRAFARSLLRRMRGRRPVLSGNVPLEQEIG